MTNAATSQTNMTDDIATATPDRYGDYRSERVIILSMSDSGNAWFELWVDDECVRDTFDTFEDALAHARYVIESSASTSDTYFDLELFETDEHGEHIRSLGELGHAQAGGIYDRQLADDYLWRSCDADPRYAACEVVDEVEMNDEYPHWTAVWVRYEVDEDGLAWRA